MLTHKTHFGRLQQAYERAGSTNDLSAIVAAVAEVEALRVALFKMANRQRLTP